LYEVRIQLKQFSVHSD